MFQTMLGTSSRPYLLFRRAEFTKGVRRSAHRSPLENSACSLKVTTISRDRNIQKQKKIVEFGEASWRFMDVHNNRGRFVEIHGILTEIQGFFLFKMQYYWPICGGNYSKKTPCTLWTRQTVWCKKHNCLSLTSCSFQFHSDCNYLA